MRVRRLACPDPPAAPDGPFPLDAAQSRHGLSVLRLSEGHPLELAGPRGLAPAVVDRVEAGPRGRRVLWVRLTGPFARPQTAPGPALGLALIKGPRFDWAVEKAAELGASSLTPLMTSRTAMATAGDPKRARWLRLAEEARKQCGRPEPMAIGEPLDLPRWLAGPFSGPKIVLHPGGRPFPENLPPSGALLVGPEGGLTDGELLLAEAGGFEPVSLGAVILRSETAALAALARWPAPVG